MSAEALELAAFFERRAKHPESGFSVQTFVTVEGALLVAQALRLLAQPAPAQAEAEAWEASEEEALKGLRAEHDALRLKYGYRNRLARELMRSLEDAVADRERLLGDYRSGSSSMQRVIRARDALAAAGGS